MNTTTIITTLLWLFVIYIISRFVFYVYKQYKQIKKSSNTLNHFIELVKGNMDKESLNDILSQFDKEVTFNVGSVIYFKCHNSHTSQYKALRNIILHRIELIEMIDEYKQEALSKIKNKQK